MTEKDNFKEFRGEEVIIAFRREFEVKTNLFAKKLSLTVAQEQKLFLFRELNDSLRKFRLFPRTFAAGPDITRVMYRFSEKQILSDFFTIGFIF